MPLIAQTPQGETVAVEIVSLEQAKMEPQWKVDRRLWLTEDKSRVVDEGDPEAAFLYATEGSLVSQKEAEKLGAIKKEEPKQEKQAAKPADKQASSPSNK